MNELNEGVLQGSSLGARFAFSREIQRAFSFYMRLQAAVFFVHAAAHLTFPSVDRVNFSRGFAVSTAVPPLCGREYWACALFLQQQRNSDNSVKPESCKISQSAWYV